MRFGDEALQLRIDGAVVLGHDVPARLRPPGGACDLLVEQVRGRHALGRPDELLLLLGQVSREAVDAVREQPDAPVRDLDVGEHVGGRELVLLALRRLVLVRGECGDVDEPGNAVVGSRGVMTVPPYEWPTRMAGLLTRPSARLTAATSPSSESRLFWADTTSCPSACSVGITLL